MLQKRCTQCRETKLLIKFSRDRTKLDGCCLHCKECQSKHRREHRDETREYNKKYYQEHKDKISEKRRKYYQEHKDEVNERQKKYCQEHGDEVNERQKKYRQEHKDEAKKYCQEHKDERREHRKKYCQEHKGEIQEYAKKYWQEHKDEFREHRREYYWTLRGKAVLTAGCYRYRARLVNCVVNDLTDKQVQMLFEKAPIRCPVCGEKFTEDRIKSLDHKNPISKGGNNTLSNVWVICRNCNCQKHTQDLIEFMKYLEKKNSFTKQTFEATQDSRQSELLEIS